MHARRLTSGLIILMAASLAAAEPPKQDALKKQRDGIQGKWKIVTLEVNGKSAPKEIVSALKLVFKDDTLTFTPGEPGFTKFNFRIDPSSQPASLDMTHAEGSKKGTTRKGIYSLEGDSLKICFGLGDRRPTELTAKEKTRQVMYTLQREKP